MFEPPQARRFSSSICTMCSSCSVFSSELYLHFVNELCVYICVCFVPLLQRRFGGCPACDRALRLEDVRGVQRDGGERGYAEGVRCLGVCDATVGMLVQELNWEETGLHSSYDVVYQ